MKKKQKEGTGKKGAGTKNEVHAKPKYCMIRPDPSREEDGVISPSSS